MPSHSIALLTDDGKTTFELAQALVKLKWKVVVLGFPKSVVANSSPLPISVSRVVLENLSEEHLQQQLGAIAAQHGSVGAFIHLNPACLNSETQQVHFLEAEKALLKQVFLIAKHLKTSLNAAAEQGRSCFMTVTQLDGRLGLGGQVNYGAISGGLFGLTKSLRLEWESVFCRAIDLSAEFDAKRSAAFIIAELHDPNRCIAEVGYSAQGRVTLVSESSS